MRNLVNGALNAVVNAARNLLTPVVRAIDALVAGTNNSVDTQGPDAGEVLGTGEGPSGNEIIAFGLNPGTWLRGIVYSFGVFGLLFFGARPSFSTIIAAAFAFLDDAWPRTQASGLEYGAIIYRRVIGASYSFPAPLRGTEGFVPTIPFPPSRSVAGIHTHPSGASFSNGDKFWSWEHGIPIFVVRNSILDEFCAVRWDRNRTCNCFVGFDEEGNRVWRCECVYPNTTRRFGERLNLVRPAN